MPSGCRQPVTMSFWPEPSALTEKTRPPLKSRTNKRPRVALLPAVIGFGFETSDSVICMFSFGLLSYANGISYRLLLVWCINLCVIVAVSLPDRCSLIFKIRWSYFGNYCQFGAISENTRQR
jgi:hypothetical protein